MIGIRGRLAAAALAAALLVAAAGSARAAESVTFPSAGSEASVTLSGKLYHPPGGARVPAVVMLHGCSGIQDFELAYGDWLAGQGYAALMVDSLGPRGVAEVCGGGKPTYHQRGLDALGALAYLRTRPDIDPKRIALLGWSHGGGSIIEANTKQVTGEAKLPGGGFRAAIGLYAACRELPVRTQSSPLLLLLGAADDYTPAQFCEEVVARFKAGGYDVTLQEFPGAYHAYDNPHAPGRVKVHGRTVTLQYDGAAASQARAQILAFLSAHL
jgi:dienelactone hydrolase